MQNRFNAVFSNKNPVNGRFYYHIVDMTEEAKAQYQQDKGDYYVESQEGYPSISFANKPGERILVQRAEKPNANGEYNWFSAGQTIEQITDDLCGQFPNIAKYNFAEIEKKAQKQFKNQFKTSTAEKMADAQSAADDF